MKLDDQRDLQQVTLGTEATVLAARLLMATALPALLEQTVDLVRDGHTWTFFPERPSYDSVLCGYDSSVWSRLIPVATQEEINKCAKAICQAAGALAQAQGCAVVFDDPLYRGLPVVLENAELLRPIDGQRLYVLSGILLTGPNVEALCDHCCMEWAGGGLIVAVGSGFPLSELPAPLAFITSCYDNEALMMWTRNSTKALEE
jgi:hypothetical protein